MTEIFYVDGFLFPHFDNNNIVCPGDVLILDDEVDEVEKEDE